MSTGTLIGQVARAAGVQVQTVRYYEHLGLLPRAQRSPAGYRVYSHEAAARLRFIKRAQALGFSLAEIKEILRLKYDGRSPCECVREALKRKLEHVEQEMVALVEVRRELRKTLERSHKLPHLPHGVSAICPIIEHPSSAPRKKKRG